MAKGKAKKKGRKRKPGVKRTVPSKVRGHVVTALKNVRASKVALEQSAPGARKAFAELHGVESRLSRLV